RRFRRPTRRTRRSPPCRARACPLDGRRGSDTAARVRLRACPCRRASCRRRSRARRRCRPRYRRRRSRGRGPGGDPARCRSARPARAWRLAGCELARENYNIFIRLPLALIAALLIVRLPSLVQPMGPDQALYSYIGERILHGDLAYRDAFDQKPPGIHYLYAGLRALSRRDAIVPAADLAAAAIGAALLWVVGSRLAGPPPGGVSAPVLLLPSRSRLGR